MGRLPAFAAIAVAAVCLRLGIYAWLAQPFAGLVEATCQFDCGWYERIALAGYGADAEFFNYGGYPHWAFFPLYPLAIRAAHAALGISALQAGIALSNACLCGLAVVGAVYLRATRPNFAPRLWLILVLLSPFGFFFSIVYTEALFAVLAAAALLALRARRPLLAAGLAALASASRPTGVMLTPIIAADRLIALWRGRGRPDRVALLGETLLPIALAPLGLFLFMLAQYLQVGDALAFSHVQILWDRSWGNPVDRLWHGLARWDFAVFPAHFSSAFAAACALLGLIAAAWLAWRRHFAEAWFLGVCILLPAASGLDSLPRYVFTHPVFLFAAYDAPQALPARANGATARAGLAAALAALQITLFQAYISGAGGVF